MIFFFLCNLIPYSSNYQKAEGSGSWELVYDNLWLRNHNFGSFGIESRLLNIQPHPRMYDITIVERGAHYVFSRNNSSGGVSSHTVTLGHIGSYDTRLYEHRITVLSGNPVVTGDSINLDNDSRFTNPGGFEFPRWFGNGGMVYDTTPVGGSRVIPARYEPRTIHVIPTHHTLDSYVRVERRYVAEEPVIENIYEYTINGNSLLVSSEFVSVGVPWVLQHGHIWSTNPANLTTDLPTKTSLGYRTSAGVFTSNLTTLQSGVTYFVRPYAVHALGTFYGEIQPVTLNTPPEILLTTREDEMVSEKGEYILAGQVRDADGDNVKLTATVGGVTKTENFANVSNWRQFSFTFNIQGDQISQGEHQVKLVADDGKGGITERNLLLNVSTGIGNGVFILKDAFVAEYPEKEYSDLENDPKYREQYKFYHEPFHYDNNNGLFDRHNEWITVVADEIPVDRFSRVGKYSLDLRAQDNPFNPYSPASWVEFRKWSADSINMVNFFVHRKPISEYSVNVAPNGSNKRVRIFDFSYDLDNISRPDKGISQIQTKFRPKGDLYWSEPITQNYNIETTYLVSNSLPPNQDYQVAVRVRDIDGVGGLGVWSDWVEADFRTVDSPIAGFEINPIRGIRGTQFTITPNVAIIGEHSYHLIRNRDNTQLASLTRNNTAPFILTSPHFNQLVDREDFYTVRQVVGTGITASVIRRTVSIFNQPPVIQWAQCDSRDLAGTSINNPATVIHEQPEFAWRFNDNDPADTQKGYQILVYNGNSLIDSTFVQGATTISDANSRWRIGVNLEHDTVYRAVFRTYDGYDWSTNYTGYFKIVVNKPPVANFVFTPNPSNRLVPTEFTCTSYDPEGQVLTRHWEWRRQGHINWTAFGGNFVNPIMQFTTLDDHQVKLTVTDPEGLSDSLIRTVPMENFAPIAGLTIEPLIAYEGAFL